MTLTDITLKIIRDHLDVAGNISTDATFGDLGADSLDVVEIAIAIEVELGFNTDAFDDWGFDTTVAQACADVEAAAQRMAA